MHVTTRPHGSIIPDWPVFAHCTQYRRFSTARILAISKCRLGSIYDCFCNNKRMSPISLSLSCGLLSATKSVSTVNASGVNLGGKTHAFLRNHTKENATCVEGVSVYEMLFEGLGGPNSKLCGLFRVYPISN